MKIYHNITKETCPRQRLGWGPDYGVVVTIENPITGLGIPDVKDYFDNWKGYWNKFAKDKRARDLYNNFKLLNLLYSINPLSVDVPSGAQAKTQFPLEIRIYVRFRYIGDLFHLIRINELYDKVVKAINEYLTPYSFGFDTLIIGTSKDLGYFEKLLNLSINQVPNSTTPTASSLSSSMVAVVTAVALLSFLGYKQWKR